MEELIYSYTRKQALEDGVLIDVSTMAREAGFTVPVAVTDTVWNEYIQWPNTDMAQDTTGRLWDVLSMLQLAINRNKSASQIFYRLYVVPRDGKSKKPKLTFLKAIIGAGDSGEPVITIMLPKED